MNDRETEIDLHLYRRVIDPPFYSHRFEPFEFLFHSNFIRFYISMKQLEKEQFMFDASQSKRCGQLL